MSILFVHERAAFLGGIEQNVADTVQMFKRRGVACHLAYDPKVPADAKFIGLFESTHACNELGGAANSHSTPELADVASAIGVSCLYLHKIPTVPDSVLRMPLRKVQMVHDHDLCCPRRHKYYAHNGRVCTSAMGLRCYLDGAFLARDRTSSLGVRYESIGLKREEMRRRQKLDLSLVASQFMRQELLANGFDPLRVKVVPLAVDEVPRPAAKPASAIPTVLYVGQLIRGKGVDMLLRSLAQLGLPFRAVIVGKGNAELELRKLGRSLRIDSSLEFIGWVDHEGLAKFYAQADIVAVPSRWPEPFGLVGLEAMRNAKPVVAFNVGGIPDWLQDGRTGLLVPAGDVRSFAESLRTLLVDTELAIRMGQAGASKAATHFNRTTYTDRLLEWLLPGAPNTAVNDEMEYAI